MEVISNIACCFTWNPFVSGASEAGLLRLAHHANLFPILARVVFGHPVLFPIIWLLLGDTTYQICLHLILFIVLQSFLMRLLGIKQKVLFCIGLFCCCCQESLSILTKYRINVGLEHRENHCRAVPFFNQLCISALIHASYFLGLLQTKYICYILFFLQRI